MRYQAGHKEESRRRILDAASVLFRRDGVAETGLPKVMDKAGMTVGGFYRHFRSKAVLFREALSLSLGQTLHLLRRGSGHGFPWLKAAAATYLNAEHRANVARGCPLPSLTPEIVRADPEIRQTCEKSLLQIIEELEPRMPEQTRLDPRDRAWSFMALNVGGLMLARAVEEPQLAEEILSACRAAAVADEPVGDA